MAKPNPATVQTRVSAHHRAIHHRAFLLAATLLVGVGALIAMGAARAEVQLLPQALPVTVETSGDTATIEVKLVDQTLADLTLSFDDANGLAPSSLGVSAELVDPTSPALLARLSDPQLNQLAGALPLLVTIEPPANGGLSFERTVRVELHTHLLAYTAGSSLRLFKAPLDGDFRDITDEIASGSVRARGTTGGFSQFLVLADLRETRDVVAEKVTWLRHRIDLLPAGEQPAFDGYLDTMEAAVASEDFSAATTALDLFRARAAERAGDELAATWQAGGALQNHAGELISGAATLKFSIAYLRDFGQ